MKQHPSMKKHPLALAALAVFASAPLAAQAAPTVSFASPSAGATISEPINQSGACEVSGSRIARVAFSIRRVGASSWTSLNTEGSAPWQCNIDPRNFASGDYTLRAVARDSAGATATATRGIRIANGTTSGGDSGGDTSTTSGVSFRAPTGGQTLSGNLYQSSACEAVTSGISVARVRFYLDSTALNTETGRPYQCNLDTRRFANGTHTLRAVALNSSGRTTGSAQISVNIQNGASNTAPTVSFRSPAAGAQLSGMVNSTSCEATAADSDGSVSRVDFTMTNGSSSTAVGSRTAAPYQCAIDTTRLANGSYTLMAVATDNGGATSTTQRSVSVNNTSTDDGGSTSPVAAADIITRISADQSFSNQNGYTAQVINTYTSASNIPEAGIHGTSLANGETLRLGKVMDPAGSGRRALAFQVHRNDPLTSKGKRAEMSVTPNIEMNKTYWIAYRVYIYDWGTLASGDDALFGSQLHSGDNSAGVGGPSYGIYVTPNTGGRQLRVHARYNTQVNPEGSSNTVKINYPSYPIPFGRWTDFVVKVKHNINGNGVLRVWMNGTLIASRDGSLGFDTGHRDYVKFGYYNWSSSMGSTARKVLMRSPLIVRDPTGGTYSYAQVKALLDSQ